MAVCKPTHASVYSGSCVILPTKHAKSISIAPPFGSTWVRVCWNTWSIRTSGKHFPGTVERTAFALDCARHKCEWVLEKLGDRVNYVLASEVSFGPHPFLPFLAGDEEMLYFIERKRGFHLSLSLLSEKANYEMSQVNSWEALLAFAEQAGFPSHALTVRPDNRATQSTHGGPFVVARSR